MTRLQTLTANEWERSAAPLQEEVVRRIQGNATHHETLLAVVQLDTGAAGSQTSNGGLQQTQESRQIERAGLVEVALSQEIRNGDHLEITGHGLWAVIGDAIGEDAGSKTFLIRQVSRISGRKPNVNTKQ
jgi:hypothetical protein